MCIRAKKRDVTAAAPPIAVVDVAIAPPPHVAVVRVVAFGVVVVAVLVCYGKEIKK